MEPAGKQGVRARVAGASIAALIVAVAAMMIVPLPTWLLDLLITANLAASVALLLGAAYAPGAASIAGFPTVLVLATLFRLGLNVSTVRLILAQADAGSVIRAFGSFVVRGDYVVGFAVFLILTIVQYVVIARGAERVAEVAARFALDAMPGRQLAIDADLRAGSLDAAEARRRRDDLQREAQLYGSLDGAMRFVKGDAIAGILILVVSLAGGLAIGVLREGMPIGRAARLYTLLTVGDGLASQIPALLVSTAAGLLVTRVAAEEEARGSGGAGVLGQLRARPALLFVVAALLGVLAVLPGLPALPFGAVAIACGAVALVVLLRRNKGDLRDAARGPLLPAPAPAVELRLGRELAVLPDAARAIEAAARAVVDDLGLPLAPPARALDPALDPRGFALRLHGVAVTEGVLEGEVAGLGAAIEEALRRRAGELLGPDEVQRLLDALAAESPVLVRETVPKKADLALLTQALRRLLAEGLPIGDLRDALLAIAQLREPARDPVLLAERLRAASARRLSARLAPTGRLAALLLDPLVEEAIRDAVRPAEHAPGGAELALEPDLAADVLAALDERLASPDAPGVLLTAPELRRHVRRLVEDTHPELLVVSFTELLPAVEVEPAGRIGAGPGGAIASA